MDRPRVVRLLRIAASAACLIVCVLLIALWVRSYRINEVVVLPIGSTRVYVQSVVGRIVLARAANAVSFQQDITDLQAIRAVVHKSENALGFRFHRSPFSDLLSVQLPHYWFLIAFATMAALPWMQWSRRFSLRTLLIAVTLVAVVLGLVVYLAG